MNQQSKKQFVRVSQHHIPLTEAANSFIPYLNIRQD